VIIERILFRKSLVAELAGVVLHSGMEVHMVLTNKFVIIIYVFQTARRHFFWNNCLISFLISPSVKLYIFGKIF
jgi:hypothetical protein